MNRHRHPMGSWLSDLTGFNIEAGNVLPGAGNTALDQLKVNLVGAAAQSTDVRNALTQSGQQAAISSTASAIVKYQKYFLVGGLFVVAGMGYLLLQKRKRA